MPKEKKQSEMPFLEHLEELRWRLVWSAGALAIGFAIAFVITSQFDVIGIVARPILPFLPDHKLIYTHPAESFSIVVQIAFYFGLLLALPVIVYQIWGFLSPALHGHEKRLVIPALYAAVFLFGCGAALAYFFVLPFSLNFLEHFQSQSLRPMIAADEYLSFVLTLAIGFGAVFELPLVIVGLTAIGLVKPQMLTKYRRHAVVACWLLSAIITPGDFLGATFALAVPLYILFEISVVLSYMVYRRREKRLRTEQLAT